MNLKKLGILKSLTKINKGPSEIIIDEEPLEKIRMNAPLILEEIDEVPEHEQEVNQEPDHNIGDDDFQSTHTN